MIQRLRENLLAIIICVGLCVAPIKAYASPPPTTNYSIDASATVGSNDWYTSAIPITLQATPGSDPVASTSYYIDSGTPATSSANPTSTTLIQQGQHTFYYYSTDTQGLKETTQSFAYKLDIVAPTNWNGFTMTNSGNAHTFTIAVNVQDKTSGLDPGTAEYQYSVDDGASWGYYSTLTNCNSTWNNDLWKSVSITPNTAATTTARINIPTTDYCNSNWADTKYIRIRIKDMAGLTSTKQYALMSPWMQTTSGDVYSKGNIDMLTEGSPSSSGIVITESNTVNNFSSSAGWVLRNYPISSSGFYNTFWSKLGSSAQTVPNSNTLPGNLGVFVSNNGFTISSGSLPSGYSNIQNMAPIIFVNGDLYIDTNIQLHPSSTVVWIVSGDVGIRNSVTRVDSLFFVDGEFMSAYNGSGNNQLTVNGIVATSTLPPNLGRSLNGTQNSNTPAEIINFNPTIYLNNNLISNIRATPTITWKELITR